jgi:hypothetical protein
MPLFRRKTRKTIPKPRRPWAMTAVALLLLLEGFGLIGASIYDYPFDLLGEIQDVHDVSAFLLLFLPSAVYGLMGLVALLGCLDTLRMTPNSWTTAMLIQGINLFSALLQYFGTRPGYIYLIMAYSVFMVIYLHYSGLPGQYRFRPMVAWAEGSDDA